MKYVSQRPGVTGQRTPLRLLGVFFLLLGSLMAVSTATNSNPARAASLTVTATSDTAFTPNSNTHPAYTIAGITVTGGVKMIRIASTAGTVGYPDQFNFGACPAWLTVSLGAATPECYVSGAQIQIREQGQAAISAGTAFSVTIAANTISNTQNLGFRDISVDTFNEPGPFNLQTAVDSGTTRLVWPETVTFNANGGTGTMPTQTSMGPAALDTNTFTRAGYTFGGWSGISGANGALAYADGATYPFDGAFPTTLYARWIAPAAITPSDASPSGTAGSALSPVTFQAGGTGFYPNQYATTSALPAGLSLIVVPPQCSPGCAATARIEGTPSAAGNTTVTIEATDGTVTASATVTFNIAPAPPEVDMSAINQIGNFRTGTVGTPLSPVLVIHTKGMTGPVTFTVVKYDPPTNPPQFVSATLPPGLSIVTTSAIAAEIVGTPGQDGTFGPFFIAASDNGGPAVYSTTDFWITVNPASSTNTGGSTNTGAVVVPAPTTTEPAPVGVGESDLITEERQGQLASPAGGAKLLVGGESVDVALTQASSDLRTVAPAERTAAQVSELQSIAASMVAELQGALGANATSPISVRDTPTGAVIVGLARNPVTSEPMDVPVEDVVLVSGGGLVLMASGVDGEQTARIGLDGALEIPEGGYVSVIAGGMTPGADGEVVVMSTPRLISDFAVGTSGEVAEQAALPADLPLGDHTVVVTVGDEAASLGFRLVAASTPDATGVVATLPATGSDGITGSWAVLFLALGALALLMSTRRRAA